MEKFIEKYKSYSSKVLQKLAKVKTGDELDAIESILASRVASQEHPAEEGAVYNATETEEYKAENGIKENDEVAEEKPKKARKTKTQEEPKEPRPLKKEVSAEEAKEKANEIKIKTQEEFELDRQMLAQEGKMKVQEEYEKKEKDLQVQQRIAQSAEIGRQTKRRMVARDDLLNKLYQDAKDRLAELSLNDKEKYTAVLKDLILQGLIKIEEPDIVVRCRKVDMEIVRAVIPEVRDKYVKMMKDECALDVDVTVTLNEDDGKMLPPPPDGTPMISCSGGIIMEGHSGRLVLDNTFDKRLEVCFHDLKPVTRKCLFPSC